MILCSVFLAWGGVCVFLQTRSVTEGLSLRMFCIGKGMQSVFSLIFSTAAVYGLLLPAAAAGVILICIVRKRENKGSIPAPVGV